MLERSKKAVRVLPMAERPVRKFPSKRPRPSSPSRFVPTEVFWTVAGLCSRDIMGAIHDKQLGLLKKHLAKLAKLTQEF
jgi:hypothetical protein